MLSFVFLFSGIIILLMVIADFGVTVFVSKGAGFLTDAITMSVSRIFKFISGNTGIKKILEYKLVLIIAAMMISWLVLTWIGVSLIYSFDYNSVVNAKSKEAASFIEKFYFTGYTISTLGQGDFQPNGIQWQVFTSGISLLGFMILTISITYIVPVINSIIEKQTLTLIIASLGQTSHEILVKGYNGNDFSDLSTNFSELTQNIFKYSKNHAAYPVLHHLHNSDKTENTILKIVALDEACTILLNHVPEGQCLKKYDLKQLQASLTYYLKTVRNVNLPDEPPPPPVDEKMKKQFDFEFIHISKTERDKIYQDLNNRRRVLKALVIDDGFKWSDVTGDVKTNFPESIDDYEKK